MDMPETIWAESPEVFDAMGFWQEHQSADLTQYRRADLPPRVKPLEWQPIETAPTDYTEVIGMDASGRIARTWFFAPSSRTRDWLAVGGGRKKWHPIYWQHINDPRKATP